MAIVPVFPDTESLLLFALVPLFPDVRFVTSMPAGDPAQITARLHRVSGANSDIGVDRPVIDIDVFGPKTEAGNVSTAARDIQSSILSFMGSKFTNGVIQKVYTLVGPRPLPEANPDLVRYSASYELRVHP